MYPYCYRVFDIPLSYQQLPWLWVELSALLTMDEAKSFLLGGGIPLIIYSNKVVSLWGGQSFSLLLRNQ